MNRKYKTRGTQEPTPRIRVAREHYERIIDLADECDMKLIDVLNQLLHLKQLLMKIIGEENLHLIV